MTVGGAVDLAETLAEGHLGRGIQMQAVEDQYAVVLQRVQYGGREAVVGAEAFRVDADNLGPDGRGQFVDGQHTHRRVLSMVVRVAVLRCGS